MLLQNKYIVHLLMLFGVIALLSVVTVSSYTIAVGDMAYQKLYLGRVTIVFVICSLISLCLDKKGVIHVEAIRINETDIDPPNRVGETTRSKWRWTEYRQWRI